MGLYSHQRLSPAGGGASGTQIRAARNAACPWQLSVADGGNTALRWAGKRRETHPVFLRFHPPERIIRFRWFYQSIFTIKSRTLPKKRAASEIVLWVSEAPPFSGVSAFAIKK